MNLTTNVPHTTPRTTAYVLAGAAGLLRLTPHLWNMTPIGALGLFSGGKLRSWRAFVFPVGIVLFTNCVLGLLRGPEYFFSPTLWFVYLAWVGYIVIGRWFCRTESPLRIGGATLLGGLQFFVITNFGQWLMFGVDPATPGVLPLGTYRRTFAGLMECYAAGLPFLGGTLLGDFVYAAALFGAYALLTRTSTAPTTAQLATEQPS